MPLVPVDTTTVKVIESDHRRKAVWFSTKTEGKDIYISDVPGMTNQDYKWNLRHPQILRIDRQNGFPERAFYAIGDGSCYLAVGFQNEEKERGE